MSKRCLLVLAVPVVLGACASPEPDRSAVEARYLEDVAGIDRALTEDPGIALRIAGRICGDLADGTPLADVVINARRATGGEGVLAPEQASRLVESARPLCGSA